MAHRNILVLDSQDSPWCEFLKEFFEDTSSELHFFHEASQANMGLGRVQHDVVFVNPRLTSMPLAQKMNSMKHSSDSFCAFQIGKTDGQQGNFRFDYAFQDLPSFKDFQKELVQYLPLSGKIRLLIVDDEPDIGNMIQDFLKGRAQPSFDVEYASNGQAGLQAIEKQQPDILVLDIKMPVMDGRELYREICKRKIEMPVIIFFDAISDAEVQSIHQIGRPAIVEKGSRQSEMPILLDLIKKMVYFG